MPKYREERDRVRPVPGAHGLDKSKKEMERRNRPDRQFLEGVGYYEGQLRILVEEEYGYRYWLWTFPGTVQEVVAEWKAGRIPVAAPSWKIKGEVDEVYWDYGDQPISYQSPTPVLRLRETDAAVLCIEHRRMGQPGGPHGIAHVHEHDDSYLRIGYYELTGLKNPHEHIHVLDALAEIRSIQRRS